MPPQVLLNGAPIPPQQVCHFWNLPLELRFAIYGLAYGRDKTITPQECGTLLQLGPHGTQEQSNDLNDRRKRKSVIGRRLVSKQFLAETMQHLAETNTICVKWKNGRLDLISRDFAQHIRLLMIDWNYYSFRGKMDLNVICPRLRSLQLSIDTTSLIYTGGPEITDKGLRRTLIVQALSPLRGLESFSLVHKLASGVDGEASLIYRVLDNPRKMSEVDHAVARLDKILRPMVTGSGGEAASRSSRYPRAAKNRSRY